MQLGNTRAKKEKGEFFHLCIRVNKSIPNRLDFTEAPKGFVIDLNI
jgi:hypothetical protein